MADLRSKHLVIGMGEVGSALFSVLQEKFDVQAIDKELKTEPYPLYDVLHICYPYSESFIKNVYHDKIAWLKDKGLVIIHSTVPWGTIEKIKDAVHSPVRGMHPNLVEGIKTFVKFFGGEREEEARGYFEELGIETIGSKNPRDSEGLKLCDTLQYGVNIRLQKEIKQYCDNNGMDFNFVYTLGNTTYNKGYFALGKPEVVRPVLKDMKGKIRGHCIMENAKMTDMKIAKELVEFNDLL